MFVMSVLKYPGSSEREGMKISSLLESALSRIAGWDLVVNSENCLYFK